MKTFGYDRAGVCIPTYLYYRIDLASSYLKKKYKVYVFEGCPPACTLAHPSSPPPSEPLVLIYPQLAVKALLIERKNDYILKEERTIFDQIKCNSSVFCSLKNRLELLRLSFSV